MQKIHLVIEGMSCGHCVARVRRALEIIDGVRVIGVQVGSAEVELDPTRSGAEDLARAVSDAGFLSSVSATRAA